MNKLVTNHSITRYYPTNFWILCVAVAMILVTIENQADADSTAVNSRPIIVLITRFLFFYLHYNKKKYTLSSHTHLVQYSKKVP